MLGEILKEIGWTHAYLADRLGIDSSTVNRWVSGKRADDRVVAWLVKHRDFLRKHPAPPDWEPRGRGRPAASV